MFGGMKHTDAELARRFARFRMDPVPVSQIDALRDFAVRYTRSTIAPADTLRSWMAVNPRLFFGLTEVAESGGQTSKPLVGYYSLRPVTRRAVELLDSCRIDGAGMLPEHIIPPDDLPEAGYIGGVVATGGLARAALLFYLAIDLRRYRAQGVKRFYAKPLTPDGVRLMNKDGFRPVDCAGVAGKGVYRLVFPS